MHALALAALCSTASHAATVDGQAGMGVFSQHCLVCHQAGAQGMDGLAPPLTRMPAVFAASAAGRRHLLHTVINGMVGPINVGGGSFDFKMPSFASLSSKDLAEVLNYLVLEVDKSTKAKPFDSAEVDAARRPSMTPDQVWQERQRLVK